MLRGGEAVLVAVSGGSDSVALLDVLGVLRESLGLTLTVVHVHHGLRPEADAEAEGVRRLCERLGVACHVERVTVRRAPPWDGLEAESRRARHAALERVARVVGAARIATGHTADDQAETVLMRLLQGAGPRGLGGIAPVRGLLIRPLIETRRAAIEEYLGGRGPISGAWPRATARGSASTLARSRSGRSSWPRRCFARPPRFSARHVRCGGRPSARSAASSGRHRLAARRGWVVWRWSAAAGGCAWARWRCPRS